jgi:hypothetical protein
MATGQTDHADHRASPPKRVRGFHLADVMVWIGATALGMAWYWTPLGPFFYVDRRIRLPSLADVLVASLNIITASAPCAAAWTLTGLAYWLTGSRQHRRGNPGFAACAPISAAIVVYGALLVLTFSLFGIVENQMQGLLLGFLVGGAILLSITWSAMAYHKYWRPPRGWPEVVSTALGYYWIGAGYVFPTVVLLMFALDGAGF